MIRGRKFGDSLVFAAVVVLWLVAAGANGIFSNNAPTFNAWKEKVLQACAIMVNQNNEAYIEIFPSDREPTVTDFMAFESRYAPDFEAFEIKLKSLERPVEQELKIDELISAVEGYRKNIQKSATNLAAAKAEFAAGGQTDASMRAGMAASALGLEKCVG